MELQASNELLPLKVIITLLSLDHLPLSRPILVALLMFKVTLLLRRSDRTSAHRRGNGRPLEEVRKLSRKKLEQRGKVEKRQSQRQGRWRESNRG
jgi:hypothetical protein